MMMLPESLVGAEVAGFTIESLIGRGGMGVVYAARSADGDQVALKLMAPDLLGNQEFRNRFIREARTTVDHPSIVPVLAAGEDKNLLYIAMKLVQGRDLSKVIEAESRLLPARTARIIEQAAGALDQAHSAGLVHRDIKPPNILIERPVAEQEHVYLSDFGLVKDASSHSSLTNSGYLLGSAYYMAPEQVQGREVDGRADVYSIACVAYECLTGSVPFKRPSEVAVLFAHVHDEVPSVSDKVPVLGQALDDVFAKALAKSPEDRYLTAGELSEALNEQLGVRAQRLPSIWTGSRPRRREAKIAAPAIASPAAVRTGSGAGRFVAGAAAAIALLFGAATLRGQDHPAGRAMDRLVAEVTEPLGLVDKPTEANTGSQPPLTKGGRRGTEGSEPLLGQPSRGKVSRQNIDTFSAPGPVGVPASVGVPGPRGVPAPTTPPSPASGPRPTLAANSRIAFSRQEPGPAWIFNIFTSDIDGDNIRRLTDGPYSEWPVAWSPDGSKLAFMSNRGGGWDLYAIDADGADIRRLTATPGDCNGWADWSPDGQQLVYDSWCDTTPRAERRLYVVNADGTGNRNVTPTNFYGSKSASWSPDGKYIVFSSWKNDEQEDLHVIEADGTYVGQLTNDEAYDREPDWGANGKIVWNSYRSDATSEDIFVMNADGTGLKQLTNSTGTEWGPSWSPNYKKILFNTLGSGAYIMNSDGTEKHPVPGLGNASDAVWSPWLL